MLVLAVMDTRTVSGPGRQLAALVKPLDAHGIELRPVIFRRQTWSEHPFAMFLDSLGIRYEVLNDRRASDLQPLVQLRSLIRKVRPQVVQSHGYRPSTMVYLLSRSRRDWRWVSFHHGTTRENWRVRLYSALDLAMVPRADRVVAVSQSQRALLRKASGKLIVIENAVLPLNAGLFGHDGTPGLVAGLESLRQPLLGYVGRLSPEKGVDVLLAAMKQLQVTGLDTSLVLAGDGPERPHLEQLARDLGLAERVLFVGQVHDVHEVYRHVAAIVLPSRSEGLPNTLLEALSADVPVIATRVGGVPDVLADPNAGVLVPPDDAEGLASGIQMLLRSHHMPVHVTARAKAAARYSLDARVERHLDLYRSIAPGATS